MIVPMLQRADRAGRHLVPAGLTLFLLLVSAVPLQVPGAEPLAPVLVLAGVFYWTIYRPDLLRPSSLFFIGLLQDMLTGGIVGISPLILVTVHWILLNQRRLFLAGTFVFMWFGFALLAFGVLGLQWSIYSFYGGTALPVRTLLFQGLLTLALYPALSWAFYQVHRTFLSD